MLSLLNFVYIVPVLVALLVTGSVVNRRVSGPARTLMWAGIGLLCLTPFSSVVTTILVSNRMPTWTFGAVGMITVTMSTIGIVLLIVAVGQAARGPRPTAGYPGASGQPGWPGVQNYSGQPSGFRPHGSLPGAQPGWGYAPPGTEYGQSGTPDQPSAPAQPGQWNNPGQWGDQR